MAIARQEVDTNPTIDERAVREVEGYIDKLERQAESSANQTQKTSAAQVVVALPTPTADLGNIVAAQSMAMGKAPIVLPIDEVAVRKGLHTQVVDGARWLAEWCILMIKKYPGRVFYPVVNSSSNMP